MDTIIEKFQLKYWNLTRVLRVGFGVFFLILGITRGEGLMSVLGGLLMVQGVLNVGCGACVPPAARIQEDSKDEKEVTYEVVE